MRLKAVAIASLLTLVLLSGCGDDLESGYITKKTFEAEHTNSYVTFQCIAYDSKSGACTANLPIYHDDHYPDRWTFKLKEGDKKGSVQVSRETYDSFNVGMHYPDPR